MNLGITDRLRPIHERVKTFINERVIPVDEEYLSEVSVGDRWDQSPRQKEILDDLKNAAKEEPEEKLEEKK